MSAAKHTPEPWRTQCWSSHALISIVAAPDPAEPKKIGDQTVVDYGLVHVADCNGSLRAGGNEANAARITACVNFCAGLTNEQLRATDGAIHGYEKFQALAAQRDELLAALKLAEDFCAGFEDDGLQDGVNERLSTIRSAIAKAQP